MTQEFYLLSIIPNQQTRLKLQALRQRLFQTQGLASALAFEPVIPLAWFDSPLDSGGYARFSTGAGGLDNAVTKSTGKAPQTPDTPRIEFGEVKLWAGHLYISVVVQPENLLQKLINAAGRTPVPASTIIEGAGPPIPERASPIPAAEGIFLAANEPEKAKGERAESEDRERADMLQTAAQQIAQLSLHFSPGRSLESTRIGMYSLRCSPDFRRWWEHVEWTLEWKIQLKRGYGV
ncbi:MAG: hypothetical protein U5P10_15115 [Spirochaetia bacterium]|nr:hypothetical protein [Spirochaetia bacterium]